MDSIRLLTQAPSFISIGNNVRAIIGILLIVIMVLLIVLNGCMAANMKKIVKKKGYDAKSLHIFAWCFWTPFFGYLYAIALPNLQLQKQNKKIINLLNNNLYHDVKMEATETQTQNL